jgi:diguanylate cyclase (GGDEF)-like protein
MARDDHRQFDGPASMWRVTVAMYLAGAVTIAATFAAPDPDTSDRTAMSVLGAVSLALGLGLLAAGPRRVLVAKVAPIAGVLLLSTVIAVARPIGATPLFYLWPILLAAYYGSSRYLVATLAVFCTTFAAASAIAAPSDDVAWLLFIGGVMSFTLAGVVVNRLKRRLDAVVDELRRTAASDPLTGLLNRRGFDVVFQRDLDRARRTGAPLSLVILDLDHFKAVNDRFGHAAGDDVLRRVGEALRSERRAGDALARIGGEEFAVVLYDADADGALRFVERVAGSPLMSGGPAGPMSLSAGIAAAEEGADTPEGLMLAADRALYRAKAAGRGRAAVHGQDGRALAPLAPRAAA